VGLGWYVAYTYPRHEKSVATYLTQKSVDSFLPCLTKTSQWKDRRVKIEVPLFPGYIFTHIRPNERVKVLSIPGVIRMLCYNEAPVMVSNPEIDSIRLCLSRGGRLEPHRFIPIGERVRVKAGIFQGLEGFVVRHHQSCKLVVTVGLIHQSVALEIEEDLLELSCPASFRTLSAHTQ